MEMPEGFTALEKWADGNRVLVVVPKLNTALELVKEMAEVLEDIYQLSAKDREDSWMHSHIVSHYEEISKRVLNKFKEWK